MIKVMVDGQWAMGKGQWGLGTAPPSMVDSQSMPFTEANEVTGMRTPNREGTEKSVKNLCGLAFLREKICISKQH